MPTTLNTLTGLITFQDDHIVAHPTIGRYLKVVPEGTKPLVEGMFKPGTVEEFEELNGSDIIKQQDAPVIVDIPEERERISPADKIAEVDPVDPALGDVPQPPVTNEGDNK